ncbi:MAG TPA: ABC transporter substrate-binding protein [Acetobacteraceae bacterium]|nr:ABC transporter substrate-binding protein [Acetobacteraceae bacterium]
MSLKRLFAAGALTVSLGFAHAAQAATDIDFFFPVPVQGKLSNEMQRIVEQFNTAHPEIHVTAVYTGTYDDTNLKTRAGVQAGHPPALTLMSANFIREYAINNDAIPLDDIIVKHGMKPADFLGLFWPALRDNATENGHVYGAPFQNSTPILYYNEAAFKEVGLDPDHPPATWQEWVDAAKKLTKRDGNNVTRYGVEMVTTYDTLGWLVSGYTMSNGGQYFNTAYGGEVYYNDPTTIGAVQFLDDLVHKHKVMPEGVTDANAVANAFFTGRAAMIVNSTGALSFVRDNMKQPFRVAFIPRAMRNAVPIGGASLIIPRGNSPERQEAAWTLIQYLISPEIAGGWSRFTGYFAPRVAAYDLPAMRDFLAKNPDAKVAIDQIAFARPWFATFNTVAVRKALEDQVQAVLSGRIHAPEAMANAQKAADQILRPYVERTALDMPE